LFALRRLKFSTLVVCLFILTIWGCKSLPKSKPHTALPEKVAPSGVTVPMDDDCGTPVLPDEIYSIVEDPPLFNGGDPSETFSKWIHLNLEWDPLMDGIAGRVVVAFVVTEKGCVTDVQVIRGMYPIVDAEAVRVISSSPRWTPAKNRGKNVKIKYVIPVKFDIQ
jgi:TonB family protein